MPKQANKLVIAEKAEAARDIARALCGAAYAKGEVRLPANGNGYSVIGASGHLLALREPSEIDEASAGKPLDELPISYYPWPKKVAGGAAARKLAEIGSLLAQCNGEIYHAGDADDEGQLIVDEILEKFDIDPKDKRVKRVFVNDNIPKNIRKAFEHAQPNAEHVRAGYAAQARALGDFCFGINESRLASASLKTKVALGRVQTPTLGLVVQRDRVRESHKQREYFELSVRCSDEFGERWDFKFKPEKKCLKTISIVFLGNI